MFHFPLWLPLEVIYLYLRLISYLSGNKGWLLKSRLRNDVASYMRRVSQLISGSLISSKWKSSFPNRDKRYSQKWAGSVNSKFLDCALQKKSHMHIYMHIYTHIYIYTYLLRALGQKHDAQIWHSHCEPICLWIGAYRLLGKSSSNI